MNNTIETSAPKKEKKLTLAPGEEMVITSVIQNVNLIMQKLTDEGKLALTYSLRKNLQQKNVELDKWFNS